MPRWLTPLALLVVVASARADDWPQWLGPQRDGVWRETGILDHFPKDGPTIKWRVPIHGGYAGPSAANGKVYVFDRILAPGEKDPANLFARTNSKGVERLSCLDAATGKEVWTYEYPCQYGMSYPAGPRAAPLISGGKVYTLGAMGDLNCVDAATGKSVWSKSFMKDYDAPLAIWGFAAAPILDGNKLICVVGGKAFVVAFDKDTGKELWKSERGGPEPGYSAPMIYQVGKTRQLIVWLPDSVNGYDPETGKLYWSEAFKLQSNLAIPTPRFDGDRLLVSSFYNGSRMYQLDLDKPAAKELWRSAVSSENPAKTDNLHAIMCTPYIRDGHIYGVCSYGELRCLTLDGKRLWADLRATGKETKPAERWANAFLTPNGDRWFLFNEKGDLIIAKLTPKGYEEIDRAHILEPTCRLADRTVVWTHPAYANKCAFIRNDKEIVCVSLAKD
jgi:outer membrane protein assembly factor BamB